MSFFPWEEKCANWAKEKPPFEKLYNEFPPIQRRLYLEKQDPVTLCLAKVREPNSLSKQVWEDLAAQKEKWIKEQNRFLRTKKWPEERKFLNENCYNSEHSHMTQEDWDENDYMPLTNNVIVGYKLWDKKRQDWLDKAECFYLDDLLKTLQESKQEKYFPGATYDESRSEYYYKLPFPKKWIDEDGFKVFEQQTQLTSPKRLYRVVDTKKPWEWHGRKETLYTLKPV